MLASMKFHVPEMVTGLAGVAFIGASVWVDPVPQAYGSVGPVAVRKKRRQVGISGGESQTNAANGRTPVRCA
jgi:hypothetical protein